METRPASYRQARTRIRDGDLLLFRPRRGLMGKLITVAGRSEYSHAAMAAWWNKRLMCLETVQFRGGRAVLLSNLVRRKPGRIDVYAANTSRRRFDRKAAVAGMIEITGSRYGWWSLLKATFLHLPIIRLFVRPDTDDKSNGSLPFCSQAVARACRAGGVDPVPRLADRLAYGAHPDQGRAYFTTRDAQPTLAQVAKGTGLEGSIYAGLEALTAKYLGREFRRDDGAGMRIGRCLVDANWGLSTDVVYQFCRQSPHSAVLIPSHGRFVGASSIPFSEYKRKMGDQVGHNWRVPNVQGRRQVRHVIYDTNYWKSFIYARLAVPMGDRGCLSQFGSKVVCQFRVDI